MTLGIVVAVRNSMLDAINTAMNAGSGPAKCRLYSGSQPATGGTATTLLAELTMTNPAAPSASSGVLTLSAITQDSSADASGTATWFRVLDSNNVVVFDGTVTATGGGGDMTLVTVSIVALQPVQITSFTIQAGNP